MFVTRHYFNNIHYTKWPFFISIWVFFFIFLFVLYINKYNIIVSTNLLLFVFSILFFYINNWFFDIMIESSILGRYNRKIRSSIIFGFFLFLVSEIMLFSGFFWSFFDRIFHLSSYTLNMSYLNGFELVIWYKIPFLATLVLLTSGYLLNLSYYWLKLQSYNYTFFFSNCSIFFAYCFILLQLKEYSELTFTISDSVYSSLFFILTGFHGMHVLVGTIFIVFAIERVYFVHVTNERHLGFSLALIYWHFVDIIWIFLFLFIYFLNNWDFFFILKNSSFIFYGF